jgi:hypothetical protein
MILAKNARIHYNRNMIMQPTISHILRRIIKNWAEVVREKERKPRDDYSTGLEVEEEEK